MDDFFGPSLIDSFIGEEGVNELLADAKRSSKIKQLKKSLVKLGISSESNNAPLPSDSVMERTSNWCRDLDGEFTHHVLSGISTPVGVPEDDCPGSPLMYSNQPVIFCPIADGLYPTPAEPRHDSDDSMSDTDPNDLSLRIDVALALRGSTFPESKESALVPDLHLTPGTSPEKSPSLGSRSMGLSSPAPSDDDDSWSDDGVLKNQPVALVMLHQQNHSCSREAGGVSPHFAATERVS